MNIIVFRRGMVEAFRSWMLRIGCLLQMFWDRLAAQY